MNTDDPAARAAAFYFHVLYEVNRPGPEDVTEAQSTMLEAAARQLAATPAATLEGLVGKLRALLVEAFDIPNIAMLDPADLVAGDLLAVSAMRDALELSAQGRFGG